MNFHRNLEVNLSWGGLWQSIAPQKKNVYWFIAAFFVSVALLQTGQDFLHAHFNNYRGYLSESLLFKTYWILFIPAVIAILSHRSPVGAVLGQRRWLTGALAVVVLSVVHTVLTAGIIALVSRLPFYDAFPFRTPFHYFASEHFYLTMFFYAAALGVAFRLNRKPKTRSDDEAVRVPDKRVDFITVSVQNKRIPIAVREIMYVQSDRPYISIHTASGSYLHSSTLREMEASLGDQFVRIHRSTIVNREFVRHLTSRANGDYDITLKNGDVVRISRNYYSSFRAVLG